MLINVNRWNLIVVLVWIIIDYFSLTQLCLARFKFFYTTQLLHNSPLLQKMLHLNIYNHDI